MLASSSPWLFAGNRVLLRLCVPRYPPSALCSLTTFRSLMNSLLISFHSLKFAHQFASQTYIGVCDSDNETNVRLLFFRSSTVLLPDSYFLCSFLGSHWTNPAGALAVNLLTQDSLLNPLSFRVSSQVEVSGLEPLTSCLQSRRSTN
jgi:hypothetical protein